MKKSEIFKKVIPSASMQERENFDNKIIIDSLDVNQKNELENELICMLKDSFDYLILQTLVYLNSKKSVPELLKLLEKQIKDIHKIEIASIIIQLDKSQVNLKKIALKSFNKLENNFEKIQAFYGLSKFKDDELNFVINSYVNNPDPLVSFHSKNSLKK
ncbi:MAG: hypothetical protein PSN34_07275 [Urechidicola sp.]|nr:hypothetical protein [Urechidicola sp.]